MPTISVCGLGPRSVRNLAGDIVFFRELEAAEAAYVDAWQQRDRAIIIDGRGPQSNLVLRAGCDADLMMYRWDGEANLEELCSGASCILNVC